MQTHRRFRKSHEAASGAGSTECRGQAKALARGCAYGHGDQSVESHGRRHSGGGTPRDSWQAKGTAGALTVMVKS